MVTKTELPPTTEFNVNRPPILAFCESGFPEEYSQVAWKEVLDVLSLTGQQRKTSFFGNRAWGTGAYASLQWYLDQIHQATPNKTNRGFGEQINVETLFDLYTKEVTESPILPAHLRIILLNHDLKGDKVEWGLGLTEVELGLVVVSPKRILEGGYSPEVALAIWKRLVRHETGHLFGLPNRATNVEENYGLHCTNTCCMRQGVDMPEWKSLTEEEARLGITFCDECLSDLKK